MNNYKGKKLDYSKLVRYAREIMKNFAMSSPSVSGIRDTGGPMLMAQINRNEIRWHDDNQKFRSLYEEITDEIASQTNDFTRKL